MKKSILSPPDPFGISPLVLLLPVIGRIGGLTPLTSSLFARFEKVQGIKNELVSDTAKDSDRSAFRRLAAEEGMLKEVLDWLAVKPVSGRLPSGEPTARGGSTMPNEVE